MGKRKYGSKNKNFDTRSELLASLSDRFILEEGPPAFIREDVVPTAGLEAAEKESFSL